MTQHRVVVLGATGQVGLFCISRLLSVGCSVAAVLRHSPDSNHTSIAGLERFGFEDFLAGEVPTSCRGARETENPHRALSLLSCGPLALARDMLRGSLTQLGRIWTNVVVVGTTSTEAKCDSPIKTEREQVEEILEAQERIREMCRKAELPLVVLRPTLIYGCGYDSNISRLYRWVRRVGWMALAERADGRRQPMHVDDLAKTCVSAVTTQPYLNLETAVCGGSTLAYREMVLRVLEAADRSGRVLTVSSSILAPIAGLLGKVLRIRGLNGELVRRQALDQVFDDVLARERLSHGARSFRPVPADFSLPQEHTRIREALMARSEG